MSQREFIVVVDELASHSRLAISASYFALSLLHALKPQGASVRLVNRSGFTPTSGKRSFASTLNPANVARLTKIGLSEAAWFGEAKALPSYGSSLRLNNVERGFFSDAKTGVSINGLPFTQVWRKAQQQASLPSYEQYGFAKRLSDKGLFQKPSDDQRKIQSTLAYDLHVDTGMLLSMLIKRFQLLGGMVSTVAPNMPVHQLNKKELSHKDNRSTRSSLPPFLIDLTESKSEGRAATNVGAPALDAGSPFSVVRTEWMPGESYAMRDNALHINADSVQTDRVLAQGLVRQTGLCRSFLRANTENSAELKPQPLGEIIERKILVHDDPLAYDHLLELGHYLSGFDDLWVDPLAVVEAVLQDCLSTMNHQLKFSGASFVNRKALNYQIETHQFGRLALMLAQKNQQEPQRNEISTRTKRHTVMGAVADSGSANEELQHLKQFFVDTGRLTQADSRFISEQKYFSVLMAGVRQEFKPMDTFEQDRSNQNNMEPESSASDLILALQRLEHILDTNIEQAVRQQQELIHVAHRHVREC